MPVPKRKRSRARRDKRFANKGLQLKALTKCKNCQEILMPHQVCKACGYYKGVKVLVTKNERGSKRQELRKKDQQQPEPTPQDTPPSKT